MDAGMCASNTCRDYDDKYYHQYPSYSFSYHCWDGQGNPHSRRLIRLKSFSSNPKNPDTDGDGLVDGEEVTLNTNPLKPDTDEDGLTDKAEYEIGTDRE